MQMKGKAREAASLGKDSQWGLRPPPRAAHGLDADDGRDRGDLEPPPGIAEVLLLLLAYIVARAGVSGKTDRVKIVA